MTSSSHVAASFRDPSGFIFLENGVLYRQVNRIYQPHYDHLMQSGLYEKLVKNGLLVPHEEAEVNSLPDSAYRVIKPQRIPMISYPYEWSFEQLKDAALATLRIQKIALKYGMTLIDASAFNIQFSQGSPVLIDTLSFEIYQDGAPWIGYRQFCTHFLAPLALMALRDARLEQLSRIYVDGVPLDLTRKLLPWRSWLNFGLLTHIHLHAAAQDRYASQAAAPPVNTRKIDRRAQLAMIDNLASTVRGLTWKAAGTEWGDYYSQTNYSEAAFQGKSALIVKFLEKAQPQRVLDLGANTGVFSRVAAERGIFTIAADGDPAAVQAAYQETKKRQEMNLLPLLLDLTNPSAGIGWDYRERDAFFPRAGADLIMALALVHHLAISNNVPLADLADFFASHARWLIIEFVPKTDSQVEKLLRSRRDIFSQYHLEGFEAAFAARFTIVEKAPVPESQRILYLMERRG